MDRRSAATRREIGVDLLQSAVGVANLMREESERCPEPSRMRNTSDKALGMEVFGFLTVLARQGQVLCPILVARVRLYKLPSELWHWRETVILSATTWQLGLV